MMTRLLANGMIIVNGGWDGAGAPAQWNICGALAGLGDPEVIIDEGFTMEEPVPKEIKAARWWWWFQPSLSIQAESLLYPKNI